MNNKIFATTIAIAMIAAALLGTTPVYATKNPYDSGFAHGREDCQDIKSGSDQEDVYYFKAKYGPDMHTDRFNEGFRAGWYDAGCAIQELNDRLYPEYYADDVDVSYDSNEQQQGNVAEIQQSSNQEGRCGAITFGDCNIGQSSTLKNTNTQANSAEN